MYTCDIDIAGYPTHVIGCCPENSKKTLITTFWNEETNVLPLKEYIISACNI